MVIGNDRWMKKNGVLMEESVEKILDDERNEGHISVVCAINGLFFKWQILDALMT